ncbi:MAG: M23 family metallopeptidase, partial [Sphingomicrobium sp.]
TGSAAVALPRSLAARPPASFGARKRRWRDLDLTVDLSEDLFSRRWWRGFATLTLLTTATALLAPGFEPLPGGHPAQVGEAEELQFAAAGVGSLAEGSDSGLAMAPTAAVEPLTSAPERPRLDLFARIAPGDNLARMLVRIGASYADAGQVQALVAGAVPGSIAPGTSVSVTLGAKSGTVRPVDRIALRAGLDTQLIVSRGPAGIQLQREVIAVDSAPLRIRGRVGDGLYWSLRASGVTAPTAEEYLKALSTQIDVGSQISPDDRFDLVVANRRAATGESEAGPLLYAGIDRAGAASLQLVKWNVGGATQWFEASGVGKQTSGMIWPVNAPITSGFGERYHPILHFVRMHRGIDFGAHWGMPIVAAADGQVERAGWAGGYGQQVRLGHAGGIETSYSHMSRMVVAPGTSVRQGQLIGYVGQTGLATGPHLHYEVMRGGVQVNPMAVRFTSRSILEGPALAAFQARLKALLGVGG